MARQCELCGKGNMVGNTVSHSNNRKKTLNHANLQTVKAVVNKRTKTMRVCTRCIKAGLVTKKVR